MRAEGAELTLGVEWIPARGCRSGTQGAVGCKVRVLRYWKAGRKEPRNPRAPAHVSLLVSIVSPVRRGPGGWGRLCLGGPMLPARLQG